MVTAIGRVNQVGFYGDCVPTLAILFAKTDQIASIFPPGIRIEMNLDIEGQRFKAGFRTTDSMRDVKICPDMISESGAEVRLADVLLDCGLRQRMKMNLVFEDGVVHLHR